MARRGGLGTNLDALIPTSLTVARQEVATRDEVAINTISLTHANRERILSRSTR